MQKDGCIYAFIMKGDHSNTAVIKSLTPEENVQSIEYLGIGSVNYVQHAGILVIDLPDKNDISMPGVLKIKVKCNKV